MKLPIKLTGSNGKQYTIKQALQTGGKAGKGNNVTSTIQVLYEDLIIVKRFRFIIMVTESKEEAITKALEYCIGKKDAQIFIQKKQ